MNAPINCAPIRTGPISLYHCGPKSVYFPSEKYSRKIQYSDSLKLALINHNRTTVFINVTKKFVTIIALDSSDFVPKCKFFIKSVTRKFDK